MKCFDTIEINKQQPKATFKRITSYIKFDCFAFKNQTATFEKPFFLDSPEVYMNGSYSNE